MIERPHYSHTPPLADESGIIRECIDAVKRMEFLQTVLEAAKEIRAVTINGFNALVDGTELSGVICSVVDEAQKNIPDLLQSIAWAEDRLRSQLLQLSASARKQVAEVIGDIADVVLGEVNLD